MSWSSRLKKHGGKLGLATLRRVQLERLERVIDISRARGDQKTYDLATHAQIFMLGNDKRVMSSDLQIALFGDIIRIDMKRVS